MPPSTSSPFAWWWRILRFALLGRPPAEPDEVVPWALCVPFRIWRLPKRPDGRSFRDSYTANLPPLLRALLPARLLYLGFLLLWPLIAACRFLPDRRALWSALLRPDLAMLSPHPLPGEREVAWIRPDYAVGMFYAWEYARHRPGHHRLDDKRSFVEACRAAGLPIPRSVPAAVAVAEGGAWIVKQPLADRGTGVWLLTAAALAERADAKDLLVQERLRNHPGLAALLPPDAPLSTLRVITTLEHPGGTPRVTRVALRVGRAGRLTDNAAGGGLWAAVDVATGRAGSALRRATFLLRRDGAPVRDLVHPDSGKAFSAVTVPCLAEAQELALKAHASLAPEALTLGWDVALTARGPLLLEVNLWAASYDDPPADDAYGPLCRLIVARVAALGEGHGRVSSGGVAPPPAPAPRRR